MKKDACICKNLRDGTNMPTSDRRLNAPITPEDIQLYSQTASIDFVANAISEATGMFTEIEDIAISHTFDKWNDEDNNHSVTHSQKVPVIVKRDGSVQYSTSGGFLKITQFGYDTITCNLDRQMIRDAITRANALLYEDAHDE